MGNHEAERVIQRPKGLAAPRRSSRTGVRLDIAQGGGASAPPFLFVRPPFCSRFPLQFRPLSARQLGPLRCRRHDGSMDIEGVECRAAHPVSGASSLWRLALGFGPPPGLLDGRTRHRLWPGRRLDRQSRTLCDAAGSACEAHSGCLDLGAREPLRLHVRSGEAQGRFHGRGSAAGASINTSCSAIPRPTTTRASR